MKIQSYSHEGEGMNPVYKNDKWMVGIKNFKPVNAITSLHSLARPNKTDALLKAQVADLSTEAVQREKICFHRSPRFSDHPTGRTPDSASQPRTTR